MEESKQWPLAVRVGAELMGSFLLCFAIYAFSTWGSAIYGVNVVFAALATGVAYAVVTAIFARISGGQLNPAITVAAVLTSKTKILDGVLYVIAQVVGAIAAGFTVVALLPTSEQVKASVWLTPAVNGFEKGSISYSTLSGAGLSFSITLAIIVEAIAALIVVAAAMVTLGANGESSDRHFAVMGLAYAVGAAMTYPVTGAALNPARATGIALAAQSKGLEQSPLQQLWVFWISPVLAAAVVALVMIIAQMMTAPKPAPVDSPENIQSDGEGDEVAETTEDLDTEAVGATDNSKQIAEQTEKAEIGDQQADSQTDANEGVERH